MNEEREEVAQGVFWDAQDIEVDNSEAGPRVLQLLAELAKHASQLSPLNKGRVANILSLCLGDFHPAAAIESLSLFGHPK